MTKIGNETSKLQQMDQNTVSKCCVGKAFASPTNEIKGSNLSLSDTGSKRYDPTPLVLHRNSCCGVSAAQNDEFGAGPAKLKISRRCDRS